MNALIWLGAAVFIAFCLWLLWRDFTGRNG